MSDVTLPHETMEHLPITVYEDGVLTANFETAVTRWPVRPTTWLPAVVANGDAGVIVSGLTAGTYQIWVRVNNSIVIAAGTVTVQ